MTVFKAKKLMGLFPFQGITKSSQGLGSIVREKAKNRVKTNNKNGRAKQAEEWTGEGGRATEPGNMPLVLPFHESSSI